VLIDLSPLRTRRDFRLVFFSQLVSSLGSFLTYVALPVQIYELTHSSAAVGMMGVVQLVTLILAALWGGAVADAKDRRRLLIITEALLALASLALVFNSITPEPSIALIYVIGAVTSALTGFHMPALQSLTPLLVDKSELGAVSALTTLRGTIAAIAGPAIAGICIKVFGLPVTYLLDVVTFLASMSLLWMIRSIPPLANAQPIGVASIVEGLRYAASQPILIGTYIVDFAAMLFAMPIAIFPELAAHYGDTSATGYLVAAMSVGGLLITLVSGWVNKIERRGVAVIVSAALWGAAIVALGYADSFVLALIFIAAAGAADMVSALLRLTIWNEIIPTHLRGRLAGIEQLSYTSGPLLGNARAGLMSQQMGLSRSIIAGGWLCMASVAACAAALPVFWRYKKSDRSATGAVQTDVAAKLAHQRDNEMR
jgi:MFS family permease